MSSHTQEYSPFFSGFSRKDVFFLSLLIRGLRDVCIFSECTQVIIVRESIETEITSSLYQCDHGCDFGCVMNMNYTVLSLVKLLSPK